MSEAVSLPGDDAVAGTSSPPPATLYAALLPKCVDFATLKQQYPFVAMLKSLLGAVPNLMLVLPLFRGAFNAQSIGVSAFMNMPMTVLGLGPDITTMSTAALTASQSADCSYCTVHSCSILKRFGAPDGLAAREYKNPAQAASAAFGTALGAVPPFGVEDAVREMLVHFSRDDVEWHALAVGIMGYLNTCNDILKTDVEEEIMREVAPLLESTGWSAGQHEVAKPVHELQEVQKGFCDAQGWKTKLELLWHLPSAMLHELRQTWGLPADKYQIRKYFEDRLGGSLSLLEDISFPKARRTVTMTLRDHLLGEDCSFPKSLKYAVGEVYASSVGNDKLEQDMRALYEHEKSNAPSGDMIERTENLPELLKKVACSTAVTGSDWTAEVLSMLQADKRLDKRDISTLLLCVSSMSQPIRTGADIVSAVEGALSPSDVMEIVSWMSVLVMLNRMMAFYAAFTDVS